jgi:aminopeptidase-like protein
MKEAGIEFWDFTWKSRPVVNYVFACNEVLAVKEKNRKLKSLPVQVQSVFNVTAYWMLCFVEHSQRQLSIYSLI